MTNEEAITRINMMLKLNGLKYDADIEALKLAIEVLKNAQENYNNAFVAGYKQGVDAMTAAFNYDRTRRRATMPYKKNIEEV